MGKKERARPSWDEYFVNIAIESAERSSCLKRHVGALIVNDKQILATGYNGAPRGVDSCYDNGICWRSKHNIPHGQDKDLCMASHGEFNGICQAARKGIPLKDSVLYVTTFPCPTCAKAIIQSGIIEVCYLAEYYGAQYKFSKELLRKAKVKTRKINMDLERIAQKHHDLKLK
jgi:dCMP deaminase